MFLGLHGVSKAAPNAAFRGAAWFATAALLLSTQNRSRSWGPRQKLIPSCQQHVCIESDMSAQRFAREAALAKLSEVRKLVAASRSCRPHQDAHCSGTTPPQAIARCEWDVAESLAGQVAGEARHDPLRVLQVRLWRSCPRTVPMQLYTST